MRYIFLVIFLVWTYKVFKEWRTTKFQKSVSLSALLYIVSVGATFVYFLLQILEACLPFIIENW